jgi:quinolinate synthase
VIAHPECRPDVVDLADAVLSTSQMLAYAASAPAGEFIVVTEAGLIHALEKAAPTKRFYELYPRMLCPNMKLTTLVKVRDCLAGMTGEVLVPEEIRISALGAVERMIAIG